MFVSANKIRPNPYSKSNKQRIVLRRTEYHFAWNFYVDKPNNAISSAKLNYLHFNAISTYIKQSSVLRTIAEYCLLKTLLITVR